MATSFEAAGSLRTLVNLCVRGTHSFEDYVERLEREMEGNHKESIAKNLPLFKSVLLMEKINK